MMYGNVSGNPPKGGYSSGAAVINEQPATIDMYERLCALRSRINGIEGMLAETLIRLFGQQELRGADAGPVEPAPAPGTLAGCKNQINYMNTVCDAIEEQLAALSRV